MKIIASSCLIKGTQIGDSELYTSLPMLLYSFLASAKIFCPLKKKHGKHTFVHTDIICLVCHLWTSTPANKTKHEVLGFPWTKAKAFISN